MNKVCINNAHINAGFERLIKDQDEIDRKSEAHTKGVIDNLYVATRYILFLSTGCLGEQTKEYKRYGVLGRDARMFNFKHLVYKAIILSHEQEFGGKVPMDNWNELEDSAWHYGRYILTLLQREEYKTYYVEHIVNPIMEEFGGRQYMLSWCDSEPVCIAKDETVLEYIERCKGRCSLWMCLFPILGQMFLISLIYESVYAIFNKPWSRNND